MVLVLSRLLQGGSPRHKLVKQPSQPTGTAFSAFNPPKENPSLQDCTQDGPERTGLCRGMLIIFKILNSLLNVFHLVFLFILEPFFSDSCHKSMYLYYCRLFSLQNTSKLIRRSL